MLTVILSKLEKVDINTHNFLTIIFIDVNGLALKGVGVQVQIFSESEIVMVKTRSFKTWCKGSLLIAFAIKR